MTFEEFQATKKECADLGAALSDSQWEGQPPARGLLYVDCFYIEEVAPHWPDEARAEGRWHLLLGRDEWITDDLTALERRLYAWCQSEGVIPLYGPEPPAVEVRIAGKTQPIRGWLKTEPGRSLLARALAADDIDDACRLLQDALGITDGGIAGQFFSSLQEGEWKASGKALRSGWLSAWLRAEMFSEAAHGG